MTAHVRDVENWFQNNELFYGNGDKTVREYIEEVLAKVGINSEVIRRIRGKFITYSMNKLKVKITGEWKKFLHIYNDGKSCTAVFSNDMFYIDIFDNVYPKDVITSEQQLLKILGTLLGHFDFNGLTVDAPTTNEILLKIQNCLDKFEKGGAFRDFLKICSEEEAVEIIKNNKSFFRLFQIIDAFNKEKKVRTMFEVNTKPTDNFVNLRLMFENYQYYVIGPQTLMENFGDFQNFLTYINLNKEADGFHFSMEFIENFNAESIKKHNTYVTCNFGSTIKLSICYYIASQIARYVKTNHSDLFERFDLYCFQSILLWVEQYYMAKADSANVPLVPLDDFYNNAHNLKEHFCDLLKKTKDCPKSIHQFKTHYSAVYHFKKHYKSIRLKIKLNKNLSALFKHVLKKTSINSQLNFYLQQLPDYIFTGFYDLTPNNENSRFQLYIFVKQNITGFKFKECEDYTQVISCENMNTVDNVNWHVDTFIKTMY